MRKRNNGYFYKLCTINGVTYVQIWRKSAERIGSGFYVRSCGTADKLQESLVRLEELEKQTKEIAGNLTKISEGKTNDSD